MTRDDLDDAIEESSNMNANNETMTAMRVGAHMTRLTLMLLFSLAANVSWAMSYIFAPIDVPLTEGSTRARGINDAGQIVGSSFLGGFLLSGGNFARVDQAGGSGRSKMTAQSVTCG